MHGAPQDGRSAEVAARKPSTNSVSTMENQWSVAFGTLFILWRLFNPDQLRVKNIFTQ